MGIVKQQMFDDEYNQQMKDFLSQLNERDELSGAVLGIYRQLITKGFKSLSELQNKTLKSFSESYSEQNTCSVCENGNIANLTDYIYVADEGICPMCEYDREKFMRD